MLLEKGGIDRLANTRLPQTLNLLNTHTNKTKNNTVSENTIKQSRMKWGVLVCYFYFYTYMYVCVYIYVYIQNYICIYIHIYTKRLTTKNNYGIWKVWNLQGRLADFGYKLPVFQFESRGCLLLSQEELLLQMKVWRQCAREFSVAHWRPFLLFHSGLRLIG